MSPEDVISTLGDWKGYQVTRLTWTSPGQRPHADLVIDLVPDPSAPLICGKCHQAVLLTHDQSYRRIRDLSAFGYRTILMVLRRRIFCPHCGGPQLEHVEWLEAYSRCTKRFALWVATLADMLPIKDAAEITGLHWGTVQQIHQEHLEEVLGEPSLDGITHIAMDEFAIQKGHRYATVIADALTHRVLWVAKGNDRQAIRPFFEALGSVRCKAIQVAVMDMHSAFATEFHNHCPSAEVVYDKFHVLAKYNREVVDRVRVDRANELRDDKQARKVVKGSKWLLLRNRENLDEDDRIQLKDLLSANEPLAVVDLMRDDLRELWNCCDPIQAEREWTGWFQRAAESGVAALKSFARRLKKHVAGLVSYCRWRLTTGFLEGMNNKIKVIKRKAYGYRNDQYFFLRIRAAFPGTPDGRYPGIP